MVPMILRLKLKEDLNKEFVSLKEESKKDKDELRRINDKLDTLCIEGPGHLLALENGVSRAGYNQDQWMLIGAHQTVDSMECGLCGFSSKLFDEAKCLTYTIDNLKINYFQRDPDNFERLSMFGRIPFHDDDVKMYIPKWTKLGSGPLFGNLCRVCVYKDNVVYYVYSKDQYQHGIHNMYKNYMSKNNKKFYYIVISNVFLKVKEKNKGVAVFFLNCTAISSDANDILNNTIVQNYIGKIGFCGYDSDDIDFMLASFNASYVNGDENNVKWINSLSIDPDKDSSLSTSGNSNLKIMEMPYDTDMYRKIGFEIGYITRQDDN